MKKSKNLKKLLFLFSTALLVGCAENGYKNSWQEEELNGNVKSIRQLAFSFAEENGQIVILDTLATDNFFILFDEKGNETQRTFFAFNGQPVNISRLEYDEKGRKIKKITSDMQGNVGETSVYSYNSKGQLTEETFENIGGTTIYSYKYNGNVEEITISEADGKPLYIFSTTCDGKKIVSARDIFCSFGTVNETTYKTDKQGREIEAAVRFLDERGALTGEEIRRTVYQDDEHGNWTLKKTFLNEVPAILFKRTVEYF